MYNKLYLFIGLFILLVSLISCAKKESESNTSSPSIFKAVGYSGTILSSPDGITWTSSTWDSQNYGISKNLIGITYGNSKFLTLTGLMDNGTASPATVLTSANGTSWASTSATCSSCGTDNVSLNDFTYAE